MAKSSPGTSGTTQTRGETMANYLYDYDLQVWYHADTRIIQACGHQVSMRKYTLEGKKECCRANRLAGLTIDEAYTELEREN